jgi:hypothetical protein
MQRRYALYSLIGFGSTAGIGQQRAPRPSDAVEDAQTPQPVQSQRPEQQKSQHDRSDIFSGTNAPPSSQALESQPDQGKMLGFDFARDPLNAKRPMPSPEEIMKNDIAEKAKVMAAQFLHSRRFANFLSKPLLKIVD